MDIVECNFQCPYCMQSNYMAVDTSCDLGQQLIQDCQVCCQPIEIAVHDWGGDIHLDIRTDSD